MGGQNKTGIKGRRVSRESERADFFNIEERRGAVRSPTFKAGEVIVDQDVNLDCVIRNVSESGCLIKLDDASVLPDRVRVRIDRSTPARLAQIVWRSTTLAGAMFVQEPS